MKISRRSFVKTSAIASGALLINSAPPADIFSNTIPKPDDLFVLTTWGPNLKSNAAAMTVLQEGKSSLDAVEEGIRITESDPEDTSVGYGGLPDAEGIVTLDASIMDCMGNAGSVAFLQNIMHPISVARLVMEKTQHVMLAGEGAKKFALANGFKEENLLTENSQKAWLEWKRNQTKQKNHDTIGMLTIDKKGNLSGGVSTSGMAFKLHGRVGDSPIIGAAMFVDNEIGGAVATGNGEYVMKTLGSFLVVEKMREGYSPQKACEYAIERIAKKERNRTDIQIGYLALNKNGEIGAYSLYEGFSYVFTTSKNNESYKSQFYKK